MFKRVENATLMSDSSVQLEIRTVNDDGTSASPHAPPVVILQKGTALPPALRSMDVITVETSADSVRVRQPNDRNGRSLRTGEPLRMTGVELLLLRPPSSMAAALAPTPSAPAPLAAPLSGRTAQPMVTAAAVSSSATAVATRPAPTRTFTPTPYVQSLTPPAPPTTSAQSGTKPALRLMLPSGVVVFYELPTAEGAEVIVGRSPKTSGICIDDRAVQPKHLRLTRFGSTFRAVDLSEGSKTKLNLDALVWPADLVDGDELTIGGITLRYVASCTASTLIPVRSTGGHAVTHAGKAAPSLMAAPTATPMAAPWDGSTSTDSPAITEPSASLPAFNPTLRTFTPSIGAANPSSGNTQNEAKVPARSATPVAAPSSLAASSTPQSAPVASGLASGLASWSPVAAPPAPSAWSRPPAPGASADPRELGPLAYLSLQTLAVLVGVGVLGLLGVVMGVAALMMNK
jgi:hypothetical protein